MSFLQLVFSLDKTIEGNNSILENLSILTDIATDISTLSHNRCLDSSSYFLRNHFSVSQCSGGSKGAPGAPWGSKFFHFNAVFGKKLKNNSTFGSWRTPSGKSWIRHCSTLHKSTVPNNFSSFCRSWLRLKNNNNN